MSSLKSKPLRATTHLLGGACWLAIAASTLAAVNVDFSHSYTGAAAPTQNTGNITLAFTVDGSGNVSLDASCNDPDPASYVNEFDGAVGTVTDPAMWGQNFSIVLSSTGSGNLRIDNTGSGLAIQGGNAQIIDADASAVNEVITATVTSGTGQFALQAVGFSGRAGGAGMDVNGTTYALTLASGTVDVSGQGVTGNFSVASSASVVGQGFVLSSITFDLVVAPVTESSFDNGSGDNLWVTASNWNPNGVPVSPPMPSSTATT